ncbi:putative isochorismatase family protein [Lachnellula subtilissima]|uniref:Putative isochorismatase family protein n=1 Tax=Lachnellula subtilissima TaxID=602034 RepID=A0A8H8U7I2_9HELO|nr:putative isochorismatase family protein [Lachnellula subtilissima]
MTSLDSSPILLSVDLQQGMVEGLEEWGPRSTPSLVPNVQYLLKTWRENGWPVFHVQHDDVADPTNIINSKYPETFRTHACSAPKEGEPIFVKTVGSAFIAPDLGIGIEKLGRKRKIVVIGMDGSQCINSTARHGSDLGYDLIVVGDSCASYGMGAGFDCEKTHEAAMQMLKGYVKVVKTDEVLGLLE